MNTRTFRLGIAVVAAVLGAVMLADRPAGAQDRVAPQNAAEVQLSYAPLVKKTAPAVVNIYTAKTVRTRRVAPLFDDPFFSRFFGDSVQRSVPGPEKKVQNSLGSGVIVNAKGLVVTNNHVIEGAEEIKVVLNDRREFEAKLIGTDERTDIAVLAVDARGENLPFLDLSDSDSLEVGDLVLAIGNPFGVGQTVTSGIVSALSRNAGISDIGSFIQTDAAINPGNSGGALVDVTGKLVGINTAIFSKTGASHGIGFAIPSNLVNRVATSLVTSGDVVRAWLGAKGQGVTADIAESIGMSRPYGVMITDVHKGGPADKAGLRVGDVLLSVNDKTVNDGQDLRYRIATLPVGGDTKLGILRKGQPRVLDIRLMGPPEDPPAEKTLIKGRNPLAGAVIANLSPKLADELGLEHEASGVILLELQRQSIADRYGFEAGDILLEINGAPANRVRDVLSALSDVSNAWVIRIDRDGQESKLVIR
ncbi:MAG: DegQ family serine endoprotease [Alphaproteobacteria bacterium]|nr:DegQ family serine endoprotease [Alphaproteobacteria bacterium]MBF0250555.1 DegQ family serine endoprotease [Alphaproteobacteria bacterium]